ncbi:hypothetical protein C0991_003673, partial [Blastosporella zonata]
TLGDLPDEFLSDIGPAIKKVALATGVKEYNIIQNNGKLAFQVGAGVQRVMAQTYLLTTSQHIPHVHFHVVPKPNEKEGLVLNVAQNWPMKKAENEALAATCEKMKARI